MRKIVETVVLVACISALLFVFRDKVGLAVDRLYATYLPCKVPIEYSLGTFDDRFGISKAEFLADISASEALWEKSINKNLFEYVPDGSLKINLVYDQRQEITNKLQDLGLRVSNDRASYDEIKARYNLLKSQYTRMKTSYQAAVALFESRSKAYDAEVALWNRKGGAPKDVYAKLEAQKISLQAELSSLRQTEAQMKGLVDDINALVSTLNHLAGVLNLSVDQFNTVGQTRGEEFTEGYYESTGAGQEITIYQYDTKTKLIRVLTHELGHAIGLEHIDNAKAIMYALNEGTNTALTKDDVTLLRNRCGIK